MVKEDDKNSGFDIDWYRKQLNKFNDINKCHFIQTLLFDHVSSKSGIVVCFIPSFKIVNETLKYVKNTSENTCLTLFQTNPSDIELPFGAVCIFRMYSWPFTNNLEYNHYDICSKTLPGKGLLRNCT